MGKNSRNQEPDYSTAVGIRDITQELRAQLKNGGSQAEIRRKMHRFVNEQVLRRFVLKRFIWEGLPPGYTSDVIESILYSYGHVAMYIPDDKTPYPLVYQAYGAGFWNNLGHPSMWNLTSLNQTQIMQPVPDEVVAVCDRRSTRLPLELMIQDYLDLEEDFRLAIKSNLAAQKTPATVITSEDQKLTAVNVMAQIERGEPAIFTHEGFNPNTSIQAFNYNVHYEAGNMLVDSRQAWNDLMTRFGVDNSNQDKKERLVTEEVSGNNEQIELFRLIDMEPRRDFCESVNKLFPGMQMSVRWNYDVVGHMERALLDPSYGISNDNMTEEEESVDE